MQQASCPQCGAPLTFASQASVFSVCPYCSSTVYRQDFDIRLLGKMAALQEDPTVFQLGTTGTFGKLDFRLVGRVRLHWTDGAWNEWYTEFSNRRFGWFAEAQGFLMISFEVLPKPHLPEEKSLTVGKKLEISKTSYTVQDIRTVTCQYSEGELPFIARQGDSYLSVDLLGRNQKEFASLSYEPAEARAYVGEYVEFDDLNLKGLKTIDGW